jgi:Domain of unknown function (DUF6249)
MHDVVADILPLVMPILGILMIIVLVIGPIWIASHFRIKERALLHETLRLAYEKGQPPPPELIGKLTGEDAPALRRSSRIDADLRRAVVLIAVGCGVACLGWGLDYGIPDIGGRIAGGVVAGSGAIPGLIGVAYLLLWLVGRRETRV